MKWNTVMAAMIAMAPAAAHSQQAPHSGQESRAIKALSANEVQQYLAGAGLGYARAAELNSYPGPMHVLELADQLALTAPQRSTAERLMKTHRTDARAIGEKLVEAERTLDELFASGKVTEAALAERVREVGTFNAEYRLSHLETHRRLREILTPTQVRRYDELRGYSGAQGRDGAASHGKQHQ